MTTRLRLRSELTIVCALLALAACERDQSPTAPRELAARLADVSESMAAAAYPAWLRAYLLTLPAVARPVWNACNVAGTLQQNGAAYAIGTNCRVMYVDGFLRRYVVYVPNHPNIIAGNPVPLVFMFHGSAETGELFYNDTGWRQEADVNGFMVVFPTGVPYRLLAGTIETKWNSFELAPAVDLTWKPSGYPSASPWPASDVYFTNTILDDVAALRSTDPLRIHATGFSNGGGFVSRLAVELSNRLASTAVVSGPFPQTYVPLEPISHLVAMGNLDPNQIAGANAQLLPGQAPIITVPLNPAVLFGYTYFNDRQIGMTSTLSLLASPYATIGTPNATRMTWNSPAPGNASGNEAIWMVMRGVQHEYPRGPGRLRPNGAALTPNNPLNFDAPRMFWSYFVAHPR